MECGGDDGNTKPLAILPNLGRCGDSVEAKIDGTCFGPQAAFSARPWVFLATPLLENGCGLRRAAAFSRPPFSLSRNRSCGQRWFWLFFSPSSPDSLGKQGRDWHGQNWTNGVFLASSAFAGDDRRRTAGTAVGGGDAQTESVPLRHPPATGAAALHVPRAGRTTLSNVRHDDGLG